MICNTSTRLDTVYGRLHFIVRALTHDEYVDDKVDDDDDDYADMMMQRVMIEKEDVKMETTLRIVYGHSNRRG